MSDLLKTQQIFDTKDCPTLPEHTIRQRIETRIAQIGKNVTIRRALPHRDKKMIGAWCFLDHFGPLDLKASGLNVGAHPHIGLQTFTYTLAGEILHKDSLGSKQIIQPGQINLMTAGKGIAHSEESLPDTTLHGVQLWIALPNTVRHMEPNFKHYGTIPTMQLNGMQIHVLTGDFLNCHSSVHVHSPLVGLEINALENAANILPLNPKFEYGILPLIGDVEIGTELIDINTMLYLGCDYTELPIRIKKGSRVLIIGGEPFAEEILIWWNFIARTKDEIIKAIHDWNNHTVFGEVKEYQGDRLVAPELP